MNQVSRQNPQTDVENDFYKLLAMQISVTIVAIMLIIVIFQPVYDEIEELSFAKRYQNVFDQKIGEFVSTEILERQIEEEFLNKLCTLHPQDEYYKARKNSLEI